MNSDFISTAGGTREDAPRRRRRRHEVARAVRNLPCIVMSATSAAPTLQCDRFGPAPSYVEKSAIQNRISFLYNEHVAPQSRTYQEGEVSHEKMRARTRLLLALHSKDPEAIKQAKADAINAGYSNAAVGAIGRTPSDVFLFSKLPEADQRAILRQANDHGFERYITHSQMKLRKPMRDERAFNPSSPERSISPSTNPAPGAPQRSMPPVPPRGRSMADQVLQTSPAIGR